MPATQRLGLTIMQQLIMRQQLLLRKRDGGDFATESLYPSLSLSLSLSVYVRVCVCVCVCFCP